MFKNRKQLGVSWVQGEFTAARLDKNEFQDSWHTSDLVQSLDDFRIALNKAVEALGAQGADISIVYEAQELSHPLVQVPPLSERDLKLFLNQRAEQEKVSDEPILFSYRHSLSHQGKGGVLLHIISKTFVTALIDICKDLQLFPMKLVPLSEIMEQEMFRFGPQDEEVILMLAAFSDMTEILVTRGDGKILFLRDLRHSATQGDITRLGTEIKRSMLYATQQFNIEVDRIGIIGEQASSIAQAVQAHLEIPVQSAEESVKAHFWAEEAALLSPAIASNMLPIHTQFERHSTHIKRVSVALLAIAFLLTAALTATVEYQIWQETHNTQVTSLEVEKLLAEQNLLSRKINAVHNVDLRMEELNATSLAPVPAWFLGQLDTMLPDGLILSESRITHQYNQWQFTLKGVVAGLASQGPAQLTQLEENLHHMSQAVNISISKSWKKSWLQSIQQGGDSAQKVTFVIEGVIQ